MNRRAQPWLGTLVDVSIADALAETELHVAFDAAFSAIARIHRLMSFHEPSSDVSRVNRALAGEIVEVDPATYLVICTALSLFKDSCGVFDIGCASKLVEWGYLPAPDKDVASVASPEILVPQEGNRIRKMHAGWIDLGGIAKGYAVDAAIDALKSVGIQSACVNAGGDLRVLGAVPYEIAIRDPQQPSSAAMRLSISDAAVATSGAYFTRRQCSGEVCSALVDGRSGAALTHEFSVSIQASVCMVADALTKIVAATGDTHHPVLARYGASALII